MFMWPTSELPIWPGGQADGFARRDQLRVRIPAHQLVVDGRARHRDGVVRALGANAPAVEDDEDDRCLWVESSRELLDRGPSGVPRAGAELLFDSQQLVVLGDAIRSAGRAGLDLAGGGADGEIGNRRVFGFA